MFTFTAASSALCQSSSGISPLLVRSRSQFSMTRVIPSDSVGTSTSEAASSVGHINSVAMLGVEDLNFDDGMPRKFAFPDAMDDWVDMDSGPFCKHIRSVLRPGLLDFQ